MTSAPLGHELCPCGSAVAYMSCCRPFHSGMSHAPTALALMRSRYCAYVCRDVAYLLATWHPETRPQTLELRSQRIRWLGLEILGTSHGEDHATQGEVWFCARYRQDLARHELRERSQFIRIDGRWFYVDGQVEA